MPGQPLVYLPKTKTPLKLRWSRQLPSSPTSLTVIREPEGKYYISFTVEVKPQPLPRTKREVEIDLGVKDVVVTSDGWKSGNPKHLEKALKRLAREQRRLARKQKGSANWEKQRRKVARLHARVANCRRDFLHKLSTGLVRQYDVIYTESLNVKGMVKNRRLVQAISDVGWGAFVRMLEYKAEWYSKSLVRIARFFPSSKKCSACGAENQDLTLSQREWVYTACGSLHDRDINAAKNIADLRSALAAGAAVTACGDASDGGTESSPVYESCINEAGISRL